MRKFFNDSSLFSSTVQNPASSLSDVSEESLTENQANSLSVSADAALTHQLNEGVVLETLNQFTDAGPNMAEAAAEPAQQQEQESYVEILVELNIPETNRAAVAAQQVLN